MRLSRTRLLPGFVESVGEHRASSGDVGSGQGEAFEQSSIAFPGETPLTAATERPIPDAAQLFVEGAKSIQVVQQAVVCSARATRSPASDGSCCKFLRVSALLAFHEALEVARAPSLAQLAQRLGFDLSNPFAIKQQFQSYRPLFHLTRRSALFSEDGSNFTVEPRRDDGKLLALRERPFFVQVITPVKRV